MNAKTSPTWRTPLLVMGAACVLMFFTFGIRSSFGLYLQPISAEFGWGREIFALPQKAVGSLFASSACVPLFSGAIPSTA